MAQNITTFKWNTADFAWNDNPYTWDDVQLIQEIADQIDGGGSGSVSTVVDKLPEEKKKKLIRLILKRKGIQMYDKHKEVKDIEIKVEDVKLLIKEIKAKILAENIDV
tara:strand:+ start:802 stop:1125 length:324 start_codon:yes stop_codon:yes gene_type:complete